MELFLWVIAFILAMPFILPWCLPAFAVFKLIREIVQPKR